MSMSCRCTLAAFAAIGLDAVQAGLAQTADSFARAEELLDAFARELTGPIGARAAQLRPSDLRQ